MQRYVVRRLVSLVPTLIGVSLVIFIVMRALPGDVARQILTGGGSGQGVSQAQVDKLRKDLGLNDPLPLQYRTGISGVVRLDPGRSLFSHHPINDEITSRLPATVELAIGAVLVSLLLAIPVGIISAMQQDRPVDYLFRVISVAGLSLPGFLLGTLLIYAMQRYFHYVRPAGFASLWRDPGKNIQQMWGPILILGYAFSALLSRVTRSTMLDVLREDFVRTARAKGLRYRAVVVRHALRNALLPVVTIAGLQLGTLLGGAVITESVFALPGLGRYLVSSINQRDYPVTQMIVLLGAFTYVILNLLVDLTYAFIDPRIRYD
jgi:peptide/nickel transport system permease protein